LFVFVRNRKRAYQSLQAWESLEYSLLYLKTEDTKTIKRLNKAGRQTSIND